jgi:superfamily II DNA/RNA helicase
MNTFSNMGLSRFVLQAVDALGYTQPTPIQFQTIPIILDSRDVIGSAQTGTGKTAAFGLPLLSLLGRHQPRPRVLILEPTRELAAQVDEALRGFSRFTDLNSTVVYGGVGYGRQITALKKGVDVIVATPGRLLDHIQKGTCRLDGIQHLVLDEADRMLDMGFLPSVRKIVERCPASRQTLLFSATIPAQIESLIDWAMKSPKTVDIGIRRTPAETIKHVIYPVADGQKTDLLKALLEQVHYESVIVFCRTRKRADRIGHLLKKEDHSVAVIHSDRSQRERQKALQGFREGRFEVLVATDIAARGLDIADVSHVINFDVPQHSEDYIHRIGRTGRAEAAGDAFTLMVLEDTRHVADIERLIRQRIPRVRLADFNYQPTTLFDEQSSRGPSRRSGLNKKPAGRRSGVGAMRGKRKTGRSKRLHVDKYPPVQR